MIFVSLCLPLTIWGQAFDGDMDQKISAGYMNVGEKSGIEFLYENGINDWLSYGSKVTQLFLSHADKDQGRKSIDGFDLSFVLNLHWSEAMKLPQKFDFYTGMGLGFRSLDAHAGARYNFNETIGLYAQAQYNMVRTIANPADFGDLYRHKPQFSVGITISLN